MSTLLVDVRRRQRCSGGRAGGMIGSWLRTADQAQTGAGAGGDRNLAIARALLYSIREGVLGVDSADRVTFANDGDRDLWTPERCVGRRTDELAVAAVVDVLQGGGRDDVGW